MLRLLVLILLAWLVYRGIESLVGRLGGAPGSGAFRPEPPTPRVTVTVHREGGEELVPCARCGVRVPRSRTVAGEGGAVCAECAT
jgi:peptidoglycan/LPS O-acetylase OafA/YrhL